MATRICILIDAPVVITERLNTLNGIEALKKQLDMPPGVVEFGDEACALYQGMG